MDVDPQAELCGRLRDEGGLARRGLDQVRLARGPHRRQHETRQSAAAADVRQRARGSRVHCRQAGQRVQHVARGRLGGVADRRDADRRRAHEAHEQRESIELGRREARRALGEHRPGDLEAVSRETYGRCVT